MSPLPVRMVTSNRQGGGMIAPPSTVSCRCRRARASADSSPVGSSGSTSSMPVVILLLGAATFRILIGKINVAWRVEVVAGHQGGGQRPQAGVRDLLPGAPGQQER